MSAHDHLLGKPYIAGVSDCFSIQRTFLSEVYGVSLPNFARPDRFWEDPRLDLYGRYADFGFKQVIDKPLALGDVLLIPLRTPFPAHAAIVVEGNQILHHLPGRLSSVDPLFPKWASMVTIILRHPVITAFHTVESTPHHFHEVADANFLRDAKTQDQIASIMAVLP